MTRKARRIVRVSLVVVGGIVAGFVLVRFPWHATLAALVGASLPLLLAALAVNLLSLVAKGWAWNLLLRRRAPNRWIVAQEANLIGCAANSLSVSLVGEAARVNHLVSRDRVPLEIAMASIVWARAVEALGLALFLLAAPIFLPLPAILHGIHLGAGIVFGAVLAIVWTGRWLKFSSIIPVRARSVVATMASIGSPRSLVLPTLLALANWAAQWGTYHLTLLALHVPTSLASSFTALVLCNVGGVARLTPGNVGITQAAMVIALLPFGISPTHAVAAGLALQGLQIIPVLVLAAATVGWQVLSTPAWLRRGPTRTASEPAVTSRTD